MMLSSKKTDRPKTKSYDEEEAQTLTKVLVIIAHLKVLLPIKTDYLLLTNYHMTLSGDSTSQTVHYTMSFIFSQFLVIDKKYYKKCSRMHQDLWNLQTFSFANGSRYTVPLMGNK